MGAAHEWMAPWPARLDGVGPLLAPGRPSAHSQTNLQLVIAWIPPDNLDNTDTVNNPDNPDTVNNPDNQDNPQLPSAAIVYSVILKV